MLLLGLLVTPTTMAIQAIMENTKMARTRRDRGALVMKGAITTDLIFDHHD